MTCSASAPASAAQIAIRRPSSNDQPAGEEILDRQAIDYGHSGHGGLDRAQRFESEPRPVLEAAAIGVGAPVLERGVKLRNEVAVSGVDFDAVEARLARAHRRGGMSGDRRVDACLRHFLRHDGLERRLVDRMRDRRRSDRRLAANVDAGVSATMAELDRHFRSGAMQLIDQARQPRHEAIVVRFPPRGGGGGRPFPATPSRW